MEQPLDYLRRRTTDNWLLCSEANGSSQFFQQVEQLLQTLTKLKQQGFVPKILLAERDPIRFLAGFIAACVTECPVFLCNPDWGQNEWQQTLAQVQPDLIWGDRLTGWVPPQMPNASPQAQGWIMIPTGGSSGQVRFAIHTWDTLMASVKGFRQYFQLQQIHSYCVLPLYHVSGLMQFLRSFTSGGQLVVQPFKQLAAGELPPIDPARFFLSLVPTQLQRLLHPTQQPCLEVKRLAQFQTVLLGGAPAWAELLTAARRDRIQLAPTYGMTETASQIATLQPEVFLNGHLSSGRVLPHARITILDPTGAALGKNQIGQIAIQAESLTWGYYPNGSSDRGPFLVDDLGFVDEQDHLHIVGRNSHKIITGGENVFPIEVESAIRTTQLVQDVCVIGLPDRDWGQAVTAVYVPKATEISAISLQLALRERLSKFKQPKHWIAVETLPRNAQGKINYQQLQQLATDWMCHHSIA